MKKVILSFLCCCFIAFHASASIWYIHKIFDPEGCRVVMSTINDEANDGVFLIVGLPFEYETPPTMTIKFRENTVMKYKGEIYTKYYNEAEVETTSIHESISSTMGSATIKTTQETVVDKYYRAIFFIPRSDIEKFFSTGILRIRLNTHPYVHDHDFKHDKGFGKELYKLLDSTINF